MASSTPLRDLEENFFLCPVCLEIFEDPKLLPCLHRYCRKCLQPVVNESLDGTILCPMCKQQCDVSDNGIDGFKTDFHMKSVVEFIQLQKEFKSDELKKCVSCSKENNASAYCFKCKEFLCEQCYDVHISSKMFTDHKARTLKLEKVDDRNITLDKFATLKEDPRCRTHLEENANLCCSTCINEPICMICIYGKHKGHGLHDVTELAQIERELLESKIAELEKLESKLYELPKKVEATKQELNKNVAKQTDILINQHKEQVNKIKQQLEELRNETEQGSTDIEKSREHEERQTNLNYEEEINKLNKKYDQIRSATARKYSNERQLLRDNCEQNEKELVSKLERLDIYLRKLTESKDLLIEKHSKEVAKISDYCDQIIERYENTKAIASSILAAKDEWALVQCIPDIRAACEPLIEEMKKEYPQLDSLSDIYVRDMPNIVVSDVTIGRREQSDINVEEIEALFGWIDEIASSRNGNVVLSCGLPFREYSQITVINRKGKIQRRDIFKNEKGGNVRRCCFLSDFKVATVHKNDEIGIYDVRDGSYNRKYISDVTPEWTPDRLVWSVTVCPVANHIIVGTNSRFVYVFDDQLNYIRTIALPYVIKKVNDITVHTGSLLICDYGSKRAFAVTMEGSESELIYEFTKPNLAGINMGPWSVCIGKNDFIYMLWRIEIPDLRHTLVQYSHDGRHLLRTRKVEEYATCLTTVEVDGYEKLLITTGGRTRKIYEYNITVT